MPLSSLRADKAAIAFILITAMLDMWSRWVRTSRADPSAPPPQQPV